MFSRNNIKAKVVEFVDAIDRLSETSSDEEKIYLEMK
jgi:hypothetical protein